MEVSDQLSTINRRGLDPTTTTKGDNPYYNNFFFVALIAHFFWINSATELTGWSHKGILSAFYI